MRPRDEMRDCARGDKTEELLEEEEEEEEEEGAGERPREEPRGGFAAEARFRGGILRDNRREERRGRRR